MSVKKSSVVLAVILIASMLLTACAQSTPQVVEKVITQVVTQEKEVVQTQVVEKVVEKEVVATPTPLPADKTLRINLNSYPDIIDPQKSSFVNEIAHLKLIYEGLTRLDKDLKTVPGAAEKWEYNQDATELTFTLRDGLKYSDGSVLNAARFAYAIKRNINPETAGEYAQITDEIKGAPEWRSFQADANKTDEENAQAAADLAAAVDASVKPMHADGSDCVGETPADVYNDAGCNTLKLTFSRPAPYFHTVMSLWVTFPAKEENIAAGQENWWNSSKFQIGNGPFILRNLEPYVARALRAKPQLLGRHGKSRHRILLHHG